MFWCVGYNGIHAGSAHVLVCGLVVIQALVDAPPTRKLLLLLLLSFHSLWSAVSSYMCSAATSYCSRTCWISGYSTYLGCVSVPCLIMAVLHIVHYFFLGKKKFNEVQTSTDCSSTCLHKYNGTLILCWVVWAGVRYSLFMVRLQPHTFAMCVYWPCYF